MQDKMLVVLMIAAVVSLGIGIFEATKPGADSEHKYAWVEGLAIIFAGIIH